MLFSTSSLYSKLVIVHGLIVRRHYGFAALSLPCSCPFVLYPASVLASLRLPPEWNAWAFTMV